MPAAGGCPAGGIGMGPGGPIPGGRAMAPGGGTMPCGSWEGISPPPAISSCNIMCSSSPGMMGASSGCTKPCCSAPKLCSASQSAASSGGRAPAGASSGGNMPPCSRAPGPGRPAPGGGSMPPCSLGTVIWRPFASMNMTLWSRGSSMTCSVAPGPELMQAGPPICCCCMGGIPFDPGGSPGGGRGPGGGPPT